MSLFLYLFCFWSGTFPYDPSYCVTFTDGDTICFDDTRNINTDQIEAISYVRKELKATAIDDCFKGSQFFINENIARHLDKKMKRKVFDPYCCKPKTDFYLYKEYTAFHVLQGDHSFVADVLEGNWQRDCCTGNCKDLTITAIVFTFYLKGKTYKALLLEKAKYKN